MSQSSPGPYIVTADPKITETINSVLDEVSSAQKKLVDDVIKQKEQVKTNEELKKKALFDSVIKQIRDRKDREIIVFTIPKTQPKDAREFVIGEIIKSFKDKAAIYVLLPDPKLKKHYMYSQVASKATSVFDMKDEVEMYAIEYDSPKNKIFTAKTGHVERNYIRHITK